MFYLFNVTRYFMLGCAALVICKALSSDNAVAGEAWRNDWHSTYFGFLQAFEPQKERRHAIVRLKNDGRPFILYGSPNVRSFVRARLFQPIARVHLLGRCTDQWCLVRLDGVTGWLDKNRLVVTVAEPDKTYADNPAKDVAVARPAGESHAQAARSPVSPNEPFAATRSSGPLENSRLEQKSYALKELGGKLFLPVYENHTQSSRIAGTFPYFALDVKILGRCIDDWCLVQRGSLQGWIKKRHLTDEVFIVAPRLQLEPVMPIDALNVYSGPDKGTRIVERIVPPATNITPLQKCDEQWCNIRYSDVVGWVEPTYLTRER